MRCYSHLSDDEREQIGLAKALGHSIGAIAQAIGRPKSTISRELSRNKLPSGRYSPLHAAGAYQLRRRREALIERDRALRTFVVDRLAEGWTPEQISGWLKGGNERRLRAVSRGTGLGLSQVYGFVQQSGGKVTVDSAFGVGTTITLHLPLSSKPIQSSKDGPVTYAVSQARGQILVVEDNTEVGEFSSQLLSDLGYQTVLASNAEEALQLIDKEPERFDVVFSDVVMPGLDGVALGQHIRRRFPRIPFVLTSGFSHVLNGDANHGFDLLQKPYSVEDLSRVLRRALSERLAR